MDLKKLYTVEDVAKMTGLTTRTIRNYIKDGKLKGRKIGVQWRFTEEDINELFKDKDFYDSVEEVKNQIVTDFINNKKTDEISICSIIDYPCENTTFIEGLCKEVIEVVNKHINGGIKNFSYMYQEDDKKARFIIIGEIKSVQEILNVLDKKRM